MADEPLRIKVDKNVNQQTLDKSGNPAGSSFSLIRKPAETVGSFKQWKYFCRIRCQKCHRKNRRGAEDSRR